MDRQDSDDRRRLVQQYVERQRAYLPTYTSERLLGERHGTPTKLALRSDEFGFDTPVLRPRVPPQLNPGPRTHAAETGPPSKMLPPRKAPSDTQDPAPSKKDKPGPKRKKSSTPIDTDNERAARLADRRERKRKKRAIVNPPQTRDGTAARQKGRKKPAALALMYGFSATNVTKERLTLKPAPSLGVFSKGRASAKKKVTAIKKSSSKNEIFSESTFLNKPSARAADDSKVDDDSDDTSVSSVSKPQASHVTDRTKKDRGKCTETVTPQALTGTTADSEVWDIELQSKLPSSACDVSSEPGANNSAPVVLDLRGAEWSAPVEEPEARYNKTSLSVTRSQSRGLSVVCSPLATSDLHDELARGADAPSIYPSHSASQVGRRAADMERSELGHVTSKYFTEPEPVSAWGLSAHSPQIWRSNDGLDAHDSRIPDQAVHDAAMTILRVASPINSLVSGAQPMVEFHHTGYDVAPLEFSSDWSPYDDFYAPVEPLDHDRCFMVERSAAHDHAQWDLYSAQSGDDVGSMECFDSPDPLGLGYEYDLEEPEHDPEEAVYEDNGSIWWDEESVGEFLEGRALLQEWPRSAGLSGLAQAEMDVASRLRDHWRPLRLS